MQAKKKCPDRKAAAMTMLPRAHKLPVIGVHVATYAEGATEAGYHEGATPQTHKVGYLHLLAPAS